MTLIPTNTTVTVRTRTDGAADAVGNPNPEWADAVTTSAFLEQTTEVEVTEGADVAVSDWLLCISGSPPIGHRDRVVEGGRTFEVVGSPDVKKWPGGIPSHVEARLRLLV